MWHDLLDCRAATHELLAQQTHGAEHVVLHGQDVKRPGHREETRRPVHWRQVREIGSALLLPAAARECDTLGLSALSFGGMTCVMHWKADALAVRYAIGSAPRPCSCIAAIVVIASARRAAP